MLRKLLIAFATLAVLTVAGPARAVLGGNAEITTAAPGQDRTQAKVAARPASAASYTTHELTTASGTLVRQFAAADGRVFALTWSGPSMPDLRQLLGTYFDDYTGMRQPSQRSHAQRSLENADLVVQSGGRMRAFSGRAYLPSKVPSGVVINDIR